MTRKLLFIFLIILPVFSFSQEEKNKNRFPVWTFHQQKVNIHGLSLGFFSMFNDDMRTNTNGVKIELIGFGFITPLLPISTTVESQTAFDKLKEKPLSERINGISLSATGTTCNCVTNGISAGLIGQLNFQVNGISAAFFINFMQKMNGIQIGVLNETFIMNGLQLGASNYGVKSKGFQVGAVNSGDKTKGVQIGIYNKTEDLKGIQIGLWNVNQKRKLPLINWNFKKGE